VRLLVLHNLTFMESLLAGARDAIGAGRYGDYAEQVLAGAPPGRRP
jgi:queuine/archaeosine tRNA-ribosyltransferase